MTDTSGRSAINSRLPYSEKANPTRMPMTINLAPIMVALMDRAFTISLRRCRELR